jgi:cell division protein FtsN
MTSSPSRRPATAARPARRGAASRRAGRGGTLLGLFIGIALGLALAASVAFFLMRAGNPYQATVGPKDAGREPAKDAPRTAKAEPAAPDKPRFDFYKILPGGEEPKVQSKAPERVAPDKATVERAASPDKAADKPPEKAARADERAPATPAEKAARPGDKFWLQAGSFANEADAENLKAQLALGGWEASVQSAAVPEKGQRFRVRLGPYDNTDELNRIKGDLAKRGIDVAVIKF